MDGWLTYPTDYFLHRFLADLWTDLWTIHLRGGEIFPASGEYSLSG